MEENCLERMVKYYLQLQVLRGSGCEKGTDTGLMAVAQQCLQLKTLHLSRCYRLNNVGVEKVV